MEGTKHTLNKGPTYLRAIVILPDAVFDQQRWKIRDCNLPPLPHALGKENGTIRQMGSSGPQRVVTLKVCLGCLSLVQHDE